MDEDGQTEKFIGNELGQARRISMAKQSEVVVVLLDHQHLCVCRQPEVHPDTTTGMRAPYKVCGLGGSYIQECVFVLPVVLSWCQDIPFQH